MIKTLNALALLGLLWALTSFGIAGGIFTTLLGEPSYISSLQLDVVAGFCCVAVIGALTLIFFLTMRLIGRRKELTRLEKRMSMVIGLIFCAFAAYSFWADAPTQPSDFFKHFMESARFEFSLIGAIGLLMCTRWA